MYRKSFTLIELLAAISVMAIVAGMLAVALASANADAKLSRTQGQIQHINQVLLTRYEEESFRRMPLIFNSNNSVGGYRFRSAQESSEFRLALLRDYLRVLLPDRKSDVLRSSAPIFAKLRSPTNNLNSTSYYSDIGTKSFVEVERSRYVSRLESLLGVTGTSAIDKAWSTANESAECLYLILSTSQIDGTPVLEDMRSSDIRDTDEDGVPEVLDAWETPIHWIRWPAGYWLTYTIRDLPADPANPTPGPRQQRVIDKALSLGNESIDYLRVDQGFVRNIPDWPVPVGPQPQAVPGNSLANPFSCLPLVVSAGPDREFDLLFNPDYRSNTNPYLQLSFTAVGNPIPESRRESEQGFGDMIWPMNVNGTFRYPDPFCRYYVNFNSLYIKGYDKFSTAASTGLQGAYFDSNTDMEDQSTDNIYGTLP